MLYLHSMGHFHPDNIIDNKFLEDLDIGTSNEWILERVGVKTRRTVLPLDYIRQTKNVNPLEAFAARRYTNAQMHAKAAQMALQRASLKAEDIGLLIAGTSTPDNIAPAEAASVAAELGIEVPCFDMNSACSTFGMQINFLSRMKHDTLPPYILIVNSESLTKCVDYADRAVAVLFGDGAAAAVVSTALPARTLFSDCGFFSRPSAWAKVGINYDWKFYQDGNAVQGFAIRTTGDAIKSLKKTYEAEAGRFIFIGHQANFIMLDAVRERTGVLPENHWYSVDRFGNTGCSSAPGVLSMHWDELEAGDRIAMSIVGAGLSWSQMVLKVEDNQ